jgi:hypothetical protein
MKEALLSPSVRTHLLVVGATLVAAGALAMWLLPDLSLWWVVVAVVVVTHIGLLMVAGAAVLRWVGGRHRDN